MTPNEQKWAERVRLWRGSGQSAREFSAGRDFTAGGLRHWAYRLRMRAAAPDERAKPAKTRLRLARVERAVAAAPLTVEIGPARLHVVAGVDHAALRATIGALVDAVGAGAP